MMKINRSLVMAGVAIALSLGIGTMTAQNAPGGGGPSGGGRGRGGPGGGGAPGGGGPGGGRGSFDPAQMQQRMLDRIREQLEIKGDDEWKVLQPRIEKVMEAQRGARGGSSMGMLFSRSSRPSGTGGDTATATATTGDQGRRSSREANPEAEALQKAIDAKASNEEMKTALAKFTEGRKAKQAELEQAQTELRKVLTLRQEALLTLWGML